MNRYRTYRLKCGYVGDRGYTHNTKRAVEDAFVYPNSVMAVHEINLYRSIEKGFLKLIFLKNNCGSFE